MTLTNVANVDKLLKAIEIITSNHSDAERLMKLMINGQVVKIILKECAEVFGLPWHILFARKA